MVTQTGACQRFNRGIPGTGIQKRSGQGQGQERGASVVGGPPGAIAVAMWSYVRFALGAGRRVRVHCFHEKVSCRSPWRASSRGIVSSSAVSRIAANRLFNAISGLAAVGGVTALSLAALRRHRHREEAAQELVKATSDTLENERTLESTKELTAEMVAELLGKAETKEVASDYIRGVIRSEPTYQSLKELVIWLLREEWLIQGATDIAVTNTHTIIDDEWVQKWLRGTASTLLGDVLNEKQTRTYVGDEIYNNMPTLNPIPLVVQAGSSVASVAAATLPTTTRTSDEEPDDTADGNS